MPLKPEELARRLRAARELRGLDQAELGRRFDEDGLNSSDPGRIERGDVTMRTAQRQAFAAHLRVPERWLTEEDADAIVGYPDGLGPTAEERLTSMEEELTRLAGAVSELVAAEAERARREAEQRRRRRNGGGRS